MHADTEFARLLKARIAAGTAYADACQALADYHRTEASIVTREVKADPETLNRVREAVAKYIETQPWIEATSEGLSIGMHSRKWKYENARLPESKTLQNVYFPIIREICPHAVKSGRTWLWFLNAASGALTPVQQADQGHT